MDDLLTGSQEDSELEEIHEGVSQLLLKGGFKIHKWLSNSKTIINKTLYVSADPKHNFLFQQNNSMKVLGVGWNQNKDVFEYHYNLPPITISLTKRRALSQIASLYDPMGWISPIIIKVKLFMRDVWKSRVLWDQVVKQWPSVPEAQLNAEMNDLNNQECSLLMEFKTVKSNGDIGGNCKAEKLETRSKVIQEDYEGKLTK